MSNEEEVMNDKEDFSTSITLSDPLIEPFFIVKDKFGYALNMRTKTNPKYTVNGESKEIVKFIGFYASLTSCVERIASNNIHYKKEYSSLKDYINEYNKIKENSIKFMKSIIDENQTT